MIATLQMRRILSSSLLTLFDYGILLMVGVVTLAVLYYHHHRTVPPPRRPRASVDPPGRVTTTTTTNTLNRHNNNNKSSLPSPGTTTTTRNSSTLRVTALPRLPVHVSPHVVRTTHGPHHHNNNVLQQLVQQSDGCVAFVHTKAAAASTSHDATIDPTITLLFRRLLSSSSSTTTAALPPQRGSTVILAIPVTDVDGGCPKLVPDVLMRLGMYYNTFVMLVLPADDDGTTTTTSQQQQQRLDAIATLRRNLLSPEVIPTHRILASTTVEGRIAFIRQQVSPTATASRSSTTTTWPYWIVDFDPRVSTILARFGYEAVVIYNNNNDTNVDGCSGLGRMILQ